MKPIQVMMDEPTLGRLDADAEVRQHGRSAVLRRLAREFLQRQQQASIAREYQAAYGAEEGLGSEFKGWEDAGVWPHE